MKLGLGPVALAVAMVGCAASEPDASSVVANATANETAAAVVHFGVDAWEPTWSSAVVPGSTLTIDYDFDRLTSCRNQGHVVSWVMEANYRFDGDGAWKSILLPGSPGAAETTNEIAIASDAKSIELWFTNRAVGGYDHCVAYDSRFGANYSHSF